nr:tetratricopeptide repeat protein [Planctomycetota bacterium]
GGIVPTNSVAGYLLSDVNMDGAVYYTGSSNDRDIILSNIGGIYQVQGRYTEALEYFERALTIQRATGDRGGEGGTLNNIGAIYDNQGRYAEALGTYQQALAIWTEVGNRVGEGTTLNNLTMSDS